MKKLNFYKNGIRLSFAIDDDGRLDILNIGKHGKELEVNGLFVPTEIFATGENLYNHRGENRCGNILHGRRLVCGTESV